MTLFGLKAEGYPGRPKSPDINWLKSISSLSDIVDKCGKEPAWEEGSKLHIWRFFVATEDPMSKWSPVGKSGVISWFKYNLFPLV